MLWSCKGEWPAGIDVTSAVFLQTKAALFMFEKSQLCPGLGFCPGCSHSFMSSYTGLLLLPWDVPIAAAGRQPFNDLQRRLSPCGQVRAFCITTHCCQRLQIGFHNHNQHLYNVVSPLEWNVAFHRLQRQWFSWKTCTLPKCPWASHWIPFSCRAAGHFWGWEVKTEFHHMNQKSISVLLFLLCEIFYL